MLHQKQFSWLYKQVIFDSWMWAVAQWLAVGEDRGASRENVGGTLAPVEKGMKSEKVNNGRGYPWDVEIKELRTNNG